MDWENIEFDYMNRNDVLAHVVIKDGKVSVEHNMSYPKQTLLCEGRTNLTMMDIKKKISKMVFTPERVNKDELLEELGLKEYNPFKIVEKTHGVMAVKTYWIRFKGETLTYEDARALMGLDFNL